MVAGVRIVLNHKGIEELLKSPEVQADLKRRADAIANAAGPGMNASVMVGKNTARASVNTGTFDAILAETYHKALTRAIDAGRD